MVGASAGSVGVGGTAVAVGGFVGTWVAGGAVAGTVVAERDAGSGAIATGSETAEQAPTAMTASVSAETRLEDADRNRRISMTPLTRVDSVQLDWLTNAP